MSCKKYVEVTAKFDVDGTVFPLEIQWEDGAKFEIDRILDVRRAASLKAGGTGIRYTCRIRGREKIFVAGRNPVVYRSQGVRLKIEQQVMKFQID